MDKINQDRINTLHPAIRSKVIEGVNRCNEKLTANSEVRIAQALRTFKEQDALYAQGRTKPGNKVTKAKGGQSWHNYGLAFDIVLIINGKQASWDTKKDWDGDKKSDWLECAEVFQSLGFSWGKSFDDLPHFDIKFGLTIDQAKDRYLKKDFIQGTKYIRL